MPEWVLQVGGMLMGAAATYGAIRADLRSMKERVERVERETDEAHKRIDLILIKGA